MWYVYIIRSIEFPDQEYTGATADLKRRIPEHNAGKSTHTAKFKPWELVWYCAFPDKYKALEFEKYLKSHSGRAFAKKPLLLFRSLPQPISQEPPMTTETAPCAMPGLRVIDLTRVLGGPLSMRWWPGAWSAGRNGRAEFSGSGSAARRAFR